MVADESPAPEPWAPGAAGVPGVPGAPGAPGPLEGGGGVTVGGAPLSETMVAEAEPARPPPKAVTGKGPPDAAEALNIPALEMLPPPAGSDQTTVGCCGTASPN